MMRHSAEALHFPSLLQSHRSAVLVHAHPAQAVAGKELVETPAPVQRRLDVSGNELQKE